MPCAACFRGGWVLRPAVFCLALAAAAPAYPMQEVPAARTPELKGLSIEQLMDIDVTSVSRRSEPVSGAAAPQPRTPKTSRRCKNFWAAAAAESHPFTSRWLGLKHDFCELSPHPIRCAGRAAARAVSEDS